MKVYNVYLNYNPEDNLYTAVCPSFFNFILYSENESNLKHSVLHSLIVYTKDPNISEDNINFITENKVVRGQEQQAEPMI